MRALLLIAHGSRKAESNEEIEALASAIYGDVTHSNSPANIDLVRHAFLELADPDIVTGCENLIREGAEEILILPYFLASGNHVAKDVPAELAKVIERHPNIPITQLDYFGASSGVKNLIVQQIYNQG